MPWSHHVLGYEIPSDRHDWHEEKLYEGHYGYEIEMLEEARRATLSISLSELYRVACVVVEKLLLALK